MFTLLASRDLTRNLTVELPALTSSWLVAEFYYKFHSFTLECAAFLVTWYVFGWLTSLFQKK